LESSDCPSENTGVTPSAIKKGIATTDLLVPVRISCGVNVLHLAVAQIASMTTRVDHITAERCLELA